MSKIKVILSSVAIAMMLGACNGSSSKSEPTKLTDSTTTPAVNASQTFNFDTTRLKSGESFFQCDMDPEVISDKAGSCPKCGMDLTEIKKH